MPKLKSEKSDDVKSYSQKDSSLLKPEISRKRKESNNNKPGRKLKKLKKKQAKSDQILINCANEVSCIGLARIDHGGGYWGTLKNDGSDKPHPSTSCSTIAGTFPSGIIPSLSNHETKIIVKPLIVLDLNGILCRRVRYSSDEKNGQNQSKYFSVDDRENFRPFIGNVAGTPVIARSDLCTFLKLLDKNFALAVWSSAKQKTVTRLIDLLFPKSITERLLFKWGQDRCQTKNTKSNEPIFTKPLSKIWKNYPLWGEWNTLLIDDSPDKCVDFSMNTIIPPSITGFKQGTDNGLLDLVNEDHQTIFFSELAKIFNPGSKNDSFLMGESNMLKMFLKKSTPDSWKYY